MKRLLFICGAGLILLLAANPSMAADAAEKNPWEKFSFNGGLFLSCSETEVRFGPGLGVGVDSLNMSLQADDPDAIPGFDLRGNVDFSYIGLYLYGRVFF